MTDYFYLTTPIFYPNDRLHLGHAYTMVIADTIVRYKKSKGYQVYFQTGSDDHGEKIEKKAISLKKSPQELVDKNVQFFQQLWKELGISEHNFYRTSSPSHQKKVQKIFQELLNKGDIYLGEYLGKYCVSCEDYVSNNKIVNDNFCPFCQTELRKIKEPAYFFKVSKYYSRLIEHYQQNSSFLLPENTRKELFSNFLKEKVPDLCITRSDIKWGIKVPNNEKMVIYVWFEALCNYINSEKGEKFFFFEKINNYEVIHLIGKEIARFHAIYWPTILFSLNKRLPSKILAHGWLITPTGKMSKSKGNVIDPLELLKKYPKDLLRIYFIDKIIFLQDGVFSEELLEKFYKEFLVNNLSNLISRVNKMIFLYNNGVIPPFSLVVKNEKLENYYLKCKFTLKEFQKKMDNYEITEAFSQIQTFLDTSNKLIQDLSPWELAKKNNNLLLNQALNYLVNGIKIIAFLLNCFAPETSKAIFETFNINEAKLNWNNCLNFNFLDENEVKLLKEHLYKKFN